MDRLSVCTHNGSMMKRPFALGVRLLATASALFGTLSRIILASADGRPLDIYGYFTVQSNLMVCAFLLIAVLSRETRGGRVYGGHGKRLHAAHGAVLLYILVTAIIYNVLLAGDVLATPFSALLLVVNHTVTPILFLADWLINQERTPYNVSAIGPWLIYPVLYGIFASVEGAITGRFRYFFLDFATVTLNRYLIQLAAVTLFFVALSLLIIGLNRLLCRCSRRIPQLQTP